jgi:cytochrome c-type biogenesis protein CcmE
MSSKLDAELAEALAQTDAQQNSVAAARPAPLAEARPSERAGSRNVGLLVTLVGISGALVALFLFGFKNAAVYAITVDDLVAGKDKLAGRKVRVEGELVPGTLVKRDQPCEYRFTAHGPKSQLPVRYAQCVVPDSLRDVPEGGVQVTVEGTLTPQGDFEASLVMAKCASRYDPSTHKMKDGPAGGMPVN